MEGFPERREARKYASGLLKAGLIRHTVNKITFSEQCYYVFGDLSGGCESCKCPPPLAPIPAPSCLRPTARQGARGHLSSVCPASGPAPANVHLRPASQAERHAQGCVLGGAESPESQESVGLGALGELCPDRGRGVGVSCQRPSSPPPVVDGSGEAVPSFPPFTIFASWPLEAVTPGLPLALQTWSTCP